MTLCNVKHSGTRVVTMALLLCLSKAQIMLCRKDLGIHKDKYCILAVNKMYRLERITGSNTPTENYHQFFSWRVFTIFDPIVLGFQPTALVLHQHCVCLGKFCKQQFKNCIFTFGRY